MATTESTRPSFWVQPAGTQQSALSNPPHKNPKTNPNPGTNPKTSAPPRLSGEIGGRP